MLIIFPKTFRINVLPFGKASPAFFQVPAGGAKSCHLSFSALSGGLLVVALRDVRTQVVSRANTAAVRCPVLAIIS